MSAEIVYTLRCDRDACEGAVVGRGVTDEATRRKVIRLARATGWTMTARGDFCPSHADEEEARR